MYLRVSGFSLSTMLCWMGVVAGLASAAETVTVVPTRLGPVTGEERAGWDQRYNTTVHYTAFPVCHMFTTPTRRLLGKST